MEIRKELGKIRVAEFGFGGYQDVMIGAKFDLGGESWGVGDFWGTWSNDPDSGCKWTKEDQSKEFAKTTRKVKKLLSDAQVDSVSSLVGIPVEVEFEGNSLKSWRILKEVI